MVDNVTYYTDPNDPRFGQVVAAPLPPLLLRDAVLNQKQVRNVIVAAWGGNGTGSAKLQEYLEAARQTTATTAAALNRKAALFAVERDNEFTKTETVTYLQGLQVPQNERDLVSVAWPQV